MSGKNIAASVRGRLLNKARAEKLVMASPLDWRNRLISEATMIPIRPMMRKLPIADRSFLVV